MNQYAKYKSSGIDWFGDIPSHWMIRRVSTFGKFFKGRGIKKDETKDVGLPCIRYGEIYTKYDRIVYKPTSFIDEETSKNSELIKKGDVLFAGSGETVEDIGKAIVYFGDTNAYAGGDVIVLRLQDGLEPIYASYLMNASFVQHQKSISAKGEIIVHIYPKNIREIITPLPPKEEQTAIANFLDEKTAQITQLITNKQKLIELLKQERIAIIDEAVNDEGKNWESKKLKYVAKLRDELIDNSDFKIAVENIESATGRLVNMQEEKNYEGSLSAFKTGDTIFNKLRPYLHKVYLAKKDGGLFGELLIMYSMGELIPEFLFYKLFSKKFIDVVDGSTQGTKMPRANWNDFIRELLIVFPKDKREQTVIVQHIQTETQRIDNTISKIEKEIELMQEYRTALISEVVTGKIDVRKVNLTK